MSSADLRLSAAGCCRVGLHGDEVMPSLPFPAFSAKTSGGKISICGPSGRWEVLIAFNAMTRVNGSVHGWILLGVKFCAGNLDEI